MADKRTVKRLDELVTDEQIDDIVQKYTMGNEVWWQRTFQVAQFPVMRPDGQQELVNLPITQISLGMRGHLLGTENYVWWVVTLDAYPTMDKVEANIMAALESMRVNKAMQLNGVGKG